MSMNIVNVEKLLNLENINLQLLPKEFIEEVKPYVSFLLTQTTEFIQAKKNENIAKTLVHYYILTEKLGIKKQFNFPIKFGIPTFEKIGLEEDSDLQKEWAKLLVSAGKEYNPIHLQYAEILSQIGSIEAKLLKDIYYSQKEKDGFKSIEGYEKAIAELNHNRGLKESLRQIESEINRKLGNNSFLNRNSFEIKLSSAINSYPLLNYRFPFVKDGEAEPIDWGCGSPPLEMFTKSTNIVNSLILLQKLDLIKYNFQSSSAGKGFYKPQWGLLLTHFGYEFIKTLEGIENANTKEQC